MNSLPESLTGVWHGLYSYPKYLEPVYFVATLISFGSQFSGTTHEANKGRTGEPLQIFASLEDSIAGPHVAFLKSYDGSGGWNHTVSYDGILSADRADIEGRWSIPSRWAGRFLMVRRAGNSEHLVRKAFEHA